MSRLSEPSRRTVLAAAVATAAAAAGGAAGQAAADTSADRAEAPDRPAQAPERLVDHRAWTSYADWRGGSVNGTRVQAGVRPGLVVGTPVGTVDYTDPHTGRTATWEYATWTSPVHELAVPATEVIASWNAHTPAGTWIQVELKGTYSDGTDTPWYVLGRWAAGDQDIRRTSVDGQKDGRSSVWTDTFAIDDPATGLRLVSYRLRLTLHRAPRTGVTPKVWRLGAMGSDIPDRFTVPASTPRIARELNVPRYSQETHKGQYPEYDNGGEAWCSPTSSQMIIEFWGRKPSAADLAWVNPDYADPQVCHAARFTYDYQYEGCGNWPFNAAYAATYDDLQGVVTRLGSLNDLETLIAAGIPAITSQSFLAEELTGAGYGTAGHLMTVIGFTADGDVIANDPNSPTNEAVRRVYRRREWENIWLRTKRYNASGKVVSGTGGVCYLYFPARPTARQRAALAAVGVR
ncbi:peptidase C39 family protein [Streptomyces ipomoeae]|uniref:Tat pathway signal sequence domain protein n=1 Tax=Streptomyces ipomoeae 91-03 TaxID=698759 RepID=L1L217_9ACTN|nr:peptidase C39 family protein [Streptomyces ipomoeae]EKX66937.1 Tat pathway signal sequence domain protein [Streptomyces ipomoeae 91-03]MDX2697217.1 peptidase C39 family protein [Streptomyces ipomoeae]MDX2823607.1 peptidase C39 family protein [Streptomyces ipomoeae]MDX2843008.1 peptidase C39 family protein [Streptomyces ipomoeae]MDX2876139.1 peptidase C39 family protein [Streptomyces ipomoeae]